MKHIIWWFWISLSKDHTTLLYLAIRYVQRWIRVSGGPHQKMSWTSPPLDDVEHKIMLHYYNLQRMLWFLVCHRHSVGKKQFFFSNSFFRFWKKWNKKHFFFFQFSKTPIKQGSGAEDSVGPHSGKPVLLWPTSHF